MACRSPNAAAASSSAAALLILASIWSVSAKSASISTTRPSHLAFCPPMTSIFSRAYNALEGFVAAKKVNADRDESLAKYPVGPDSDYAATASSSSALPGRFDHSAWDGCMKRHVTPGTVDGVSTTLVDYRAIAADPDADAYRSTLAEADLDALKGTPNELLALYINAYNCLCIGHVTRYMKDNDGALPPSVTDTSPEKGTEIWDVEAGVVGGEAVSLNDIEHKILRSRWAEPRVHASIVCASASCPNLRAEAFVPARLNDQMDDQARNWVSDRTKGVSIEEGEGGAQVFSRIFLWFKDDFAEAGGPVSWARKYSPEATAKQLSADREMTYFKYNWNLNTKSE